MPSSATQTTPLLALAAAERAALVSADRDLLSIGGGLPIYSPADFLGLLD